jgi:hypothetical protein
MRFIAALLVVCSIAAAADQRFASHTPPRPLPIANNRPLAAGPAKFVDANKGNDDAAGTEQAPWKSLTHAVKQLKPSDTLYLRGGTYYEHVTIEHAPALITIRGYPGELAIIDGGLREFFESPATAWEEVKDGATGEFRSTKEYPILATKPESTNIMGNFGDSWIPLQGYKFLGDLRSDNPYWNVENKVGGESFVYCGPGLFFNTESNRIHCRLAHTKLPGLNEDNYRGETDPRKLPLVVTAGWGHSPLRVVGCSVIKLQDLVLRGSVTAALEIENCREIELSGLSIHGGNAAVRVVNTYGLLMCDSAVRGIAAPWTFRGSLKYRAVEARLFSANRWEPTGKDSRKFWIQNCEFTDSVDGIFLGNVSDWVFRHNLVDNISDDGLFLTSGTAYDGSVVGGPGQVTYNRFSRILTTFAFGVGHGRQRVLAEGKKQTGEPITIQHNVFDFRRPVHYRWPNGPDDKQELDSYGRFAGDHGGPAWEPMIISNNTILSGDPPRYDYLTDGLGRAMGHGTTRRVYNNIVCQTQGVVGSTLPDPNADFEGHHNLAWSMTDGEKLAPLFEKYRKSAAFEASKKKQGSGWTADDLFEPPGFVSYSADWRQIADVRIKPDSPAANSGWQKSLEPTARGKAVMVGAPYRGALAVDSQPWSVGVQGRWNVIGEAVASEHWRPIQFQNAAERRVSVGERPMPGAARGQIKTALLVQGYPAFDAPLIEYALRKQQTQLTSVEKTWIKPEEFSKYNLVIYEGSLGRAKIEPAAFSAADVKVVDEYLRNGGILVLMRDRLDVFSAIEGKLWLGDNLKLVKNSKNAGYEILEPKHPWLAHLKSDSPPAWLQGPHPLPLSAEAGERLIGAGKTQAILYRQPIGKGALIYIGFSPAAGLPDGRAKETVEREEAYLQQYEILKRVLFDPLAK